MSSLVDWFETVPTTGASFTAVIVTVNVCRAESTVPSLTFAVIVSVPLKFEAPVIVTTAPDTLVEIFDELDEVAE